MKLHKYTAGDFTLVQNRFLDEYMAAANGEFVKIYLYLLRSSSSDREISLSSIADAMNHTENDVKRALTYWEKKHLLRLTFSEDGHLTDIEMTDGAPDLSAEPRVRSYASQISETAAALEESPKISVSAARKKELASQTDIQQLIYIAEMYLGKKLSSTEVTHILYFYDELHFSADLIEYLIEYCVSKGKKSIHYIRTVALQWAAQGISNVAQAKKDSCLYNRDFYTVLNAFGIKDRGPAQAEADLMNKWFSQMGFTLDLVLEACRRTITRTHAPNFQYADKILESWKASGVKHKKDLETLDAAPKAAAKPERKVSARSGSTNRFNNFPQRNYDFDQLEQQLLDC